MSWRARRFATVGTQTEPEFEGAPLAWTLRVRVLRCGEASPLWLAIAALPGSAVADVSNAVRVAVQDSARPYAVGRTASEPPLPPRASLAAAGVRDGDELIAVPVFDPG